MRVRVVDWLPAPVVWEPVYLRCARLREVVERINIVPCPIGRASGGMGIHSGCIAHGVWGRAWPILVAIDKVPALGRGIACAQADNRSAIERRPQGHAFRAGLVLQVARVARAELWLLPILERAWRDRVAKRPVLGQHAAPGIREASVVRAQADDRLAERLQVYCVFLVPVLADDSLDAADKMRLKRAPRAMRVLIPPGKRDIFLREGCPDFQGSEALLRHVDARRVVLIREAYRHA